MVEQIEKAGGRIHALIYVGSYKVVEGPVEFRAGVPTVALPTVYMNVGDVTVSAVLAGGSITATRSVEIEGESWIEVIVKARGVRIVHSETQPLPSGG